MRSILRLPTRILLGAFIGGVFGIVWAIGWLTGVEDLTVDYRLRLRKSQQVSDAVRLVGIGDRDVGSVLGRWPFPRAVHADVLSILSASGVKHTTFDVLFTEPSAEREQDEKLKAAVENQSNVTLGYHFEDAATGASADAERPHFIEGSRFGLRVDDLHLVRGHNPVPPFTTMQTSYGAVNAVPDRDGVIRRVPLFFAHGGRLYPSLAMQTIISALQLRPDQISIVPGKEITLVDTPRGTLHVPVDEQCQYRINFIGDLGVFVPAFEYLDLYQAVQSSETGAQIGAALKDRIALVGLVSTGNTDVVSSSVGRLPGVAVQATVVSNILEGQHLRFVSLPMCFVFFVVSGALLGLTMIPTRPWLGIAAFVLFSAVWGYVSIRAAETNLILPVVPMLGAFVTSTLLLLGVESTATNRDRTRIVDVLGRYFARPVLDRLVNTEAAAPSTTERRELTIFFSDIRGFTAWTERAEPDEVASRLNDYFTVMTPIIERHGGTLDKFIGDCIMVFFGAPARIDDHAIRAVRMALDMQREMKRLNETWARRGYDPLQIGIGIHTGYVTVGSFGSAAFLDYTVIGRAVNLSARIEAQAQGGMILVSTMTHALVRDHIQTKPHPDLTVKGIPEPQAVFEVVDA